MARVAPERIAEIVAKNDAMTEKSCSRCGEVLPISFFRRRADRSTKGWASACTPCVSIGDAKKLEEIRKDPERREALRQTQRSRWLASNYDLTIEQYDLMFEAQGGKCAICGNPETCKTTSMIGETEVKSLAVDHCHDSGRVRSLLCKRCNTLIGFAEEDVDLLKNAISYIEGVIT